jgi:hypothetical protein
VHSEETHTLNDPTLWDDESRTVSNSKHCNRINTDTALSLDFAEKIRCCMPQDVIDCAYLCQITLFLHYLPCFNHELLQSIQPSLQALDLLHLCPRRMIQRLTHLWLQGFNRLVIKLHTTNKSSSFIHALFTTIQHPKNYRKITQIFISFHCSASMSSVKTGTVTIIL